MRGVVLKYLYLSLFIQLQGPSRFSKRKRYLRAAFKDAEERIRIAERLQLPGDDSGSTGSNKSLEDVEMDCASDPSASPANADNSSAAPYNRSCAPS